MPVAPQTHVKLIVGLGNPGTEYANTRHNVGFMVIERLLREMPAGRFLESSQASSRVFSGRFRGKDLFLQMPQTYMNSSGEAVRPLANRLQLLPGEILVISDDLDLPFGRFRLRTNGSDGGHNGLKSIISQLGSADFNRLRVGIGRPQTHGTIDYVLSEFEKDTELPLLNKVLENAVKAVKSVLAAGMSRTMNNFNNLVVTAEEKEEKPLREAK